MSSASVAAVVAVDPITDPRWLRSARGPGASLFTSPPWLRAVCRTYGFVPEARIALSEAGDPVGGFAWVALDDLRGSRLSSLPFSDRADPLVPDLDTWVALFAAAGVGGRSFTVRCLADSPVLADTRLRIVGRATWHGTPLDAELDELHRRISGQARRSVAAAARAGVTVTARTDLEAARRFHALHVRLRKQKYRLLAQPVEFFEHIWQEFSASGDCVTLLASLGDEVIAGAMFLAWNDVLYYKFGASLAPYLPVRPNDAIYWRGIRCGVERGLGLVDWGLSDLDQPGLVTFKRKWASTELSLVTLGTGGPARRPEQHEFAGLLGELTRLLTDESVPDEVSARGGALLYRYFC